MLTLFTIPKAFKGHDEVIQRNAIESWTRLRPECEIILCADDEGTAEVAVEYGVIHIPDVARNEYGTPLLGSAFDMVRQLAKFDTLCYVNADIIILSNFLEAAKRLPSPNSIMAGRRMDIEIDQPWNFASANWEEELRSYVISKGTLHSRAGIDYYVFPRDGEVGRLPPFPVGRPGWDNWFIFNARRLGYRVVDASGAVRVIHQNHGYAHVPGGTGVKARGPEGERNLELIGGKRNLFTLLDATHIMTSTRVLPAISPSHLLTRLRRTSTIGPAIDFVGHVFRLANHRLRYRLRHVFS